MRIKPLKKGRLRVFRREWDKVATDVVWDPHEYTFGLFEGKLLLGYANFEINGGVGELKEILVAERARNKKYGKALVGYFRHFCQKGGCHKLVLRTSEEHTEAMKFYENCGFRREAVHKRDKNNLTWYTYSLFLK